MGGTLNYRRLPIGSMRGFSVSCMVLERPGRWRLAGLLIVTLVLMAPSVPLLTGALTAIGDSDLNLARYLGNLGVSAGVGLIAAIIGFGVGWPSGVIVGLYVFPGRTLLLSILALPLLLPTFLLGLGWSMLFTHLPTPFLPLLDGVPGVILVFFAPACGLVTLASLTSTLGLGSSQLDAARLAGGERPVILATLSHAAPVSILAAMLSMVVSLGDPGPGQIFGVRTAAADLLISFSATYDFEVAGLQCALLVAAVLFVAVPLAIHLAPVLARATLTRSTRQPRGLSGHTALWAIPLWGFATCAVILPSIALVLPMLEGPYLPRASRELSSTVIDSLVFGGGAAVLAVSIGLIFAACAGRENRLRQASVAAAVALFCLPPALPALGLVKIATAMPAWLDPILRGNAGVCLAQGLRLAPLAIVLLLRAWGTTAPSWTHAAALSGVSLMTFLRRVLLPVMGPTLAISGLLVALLASADITSVLLLAPPGRSSFALRIFTVMANAPQSLVAALCCVQLAVAITGVAMLLRWSTAGRSESPS